MSPVSCSASKHLVRLDWRLPGGSWTPRAGACGSLLPYGEEVASRAGSCHCNPMILRRDQRIAGRPAKDVLKVACGYVRDVLGCSMDDAQQLLDALRKEGYVVRAGQCQGQKLYETSLKGNGLASAKLRPISRATGERTLEGFMQRVHSVNADPGYLETITGVIVLGSFISPRQKLGDASIARSNRERSTFNCSSTVSMLKKSLHELVSFFCRQAA
jgi:hypothetical protein